MTGGFYLLYKGLFQRVTTERKVRQIALKKIEKKHEESRLPHIAVQVGSRLLSGFLHVKRVSP